MSDEVSDEMFTVSRSCIARWVFFPKTLVTRTPFVPEQRFFAAFYRTVGPGLPSKRIISSPMFSPRDLPPPCPEIRGAFSDVERVMDFRARGGSRGVKTSLDPLVAPLGCRSFRTCDCTSVQDWELHFCFLLKTKLVPPRAARAMLDATQQEASIESPEKKNHPSTSAPEPRSV